MTRSAQLAAFLCLTPYTLAQANFVAPSGETVLNTDFTQVVTTTGTVNVTGGVFIFNSVTIPAGCTVRGIGSKPMIWVANSITIDGELSVNGSDGNHVLTLSSANIPIPGGIGGAAGGTGGQGSPQFTMQSLAGRSGNGPGNTPGLGGGGGILSILAACGRGSGGGGGAFATAGDPWFKTPQGTGTSFVQRLGIGGFGCLGATGAASRTLLGGGPGGLMFFDARADDDFFGIGYDVASQTWITGDLTSLVGGSGGGGGGDLSYDNLLPSPGWINDDQGGGGGGGGGCLILYSHNNLIVGPAGKVTANGGHGGGGGWAGSSQRGGGGGGGSGGLLILAASGQIDLHVKGETYANNNYDFVLSADGGVSRTGTYGNVVIVRKYGNNGFLPLSAAQIDAVPTGGYGGMGIVQLFSRPGTNVDGTNTILDDNINVFRNGVALSGSEKRRYLAWRGYENAQGVRVDDTGLVINIQGNEGDIRPSPFLLPLF